MLPDIESVLDVLADSPAFDFHKEDDVNLYIRYNLATKPKPPHICILKDNGLVTLLNGLTFRMNGREIGWRMTCKDLLTIIKK